MKIHFASDHAGFELKNSLVAYVRDELGYSVVDHGAKVLDKDDDYPDFVQKAARRVSWSGKDKAIILGGSGQGEDTVADKFPNIRSVVYYGYNLDIIRLSREHNDANVLSLGARFLDDYLAKEAVRTWLETEFSGEPRHVRRLQKLGLIENGIGGQAIEISGWLGVFLIVAAMSLVMIGVAPLHSLEFMVTITIGSMLALGNTYIKKDFQASFLIIGIFVVALWGLTRLL